VAVGDEGSEVTMKVWLLEADGPPGGEADVLGVYTSERKANAAADAAKRDGFRGVTLTPYIANAHLWDPPGAQERQSIEAQQGQGIASCRQISPRGQQRGKDEVAGGGCS